MDQDAPALIVLRGNAASGKTTLAGSLQTALGPGTANIGQDHFRRVVLREHDVPDGDNIALIDLTVRHCTTIGYHVILEGILTSDHYGWMIRELLATHPGPTHVFYLEVCLEETIRRHLGRPLVHDVPPDHLRDWFVPSDTLGVPGEVVLDGGANPAALLATTLSTIGPLRECRAVRNATRFL